MPPGAATLEQTTAALAGSAATVFIMSAQHDGDRAGLVALSAVLCAHDPLLVAVAIRRGHPIAPLIRDSHTFALSRVDRNSRLLLRKFADTGPVGANGSLDGEVGKGNSGSRGQGASQAVPIGGAGFGDPFDAIPHRTLSTGAPVLNDSSAAIDCEVVRHFDLEADHELYVGQVLAVRVSV